MSDNKEELKNKIIYRASYRGSKEMDILMTNFVKSLINNLSLEELKELNHLVNLDDEVLKNIKNNILTITRLPVKVKLVIFFLTTLLVYLLFSVTSCTTSLIVSQLK